MGAVPRGYVLTEHASDVLKERGISTEWVAAAILSPDRKDPDGEGKMHFIKRIHEFGDRWLRVIVNPTANPKRIVTAYFDRKLRREHETQG